MKKIVVLGSAGFIGGTLYKRLLSKGIEAHAVASSSTGRALHKDCYWLLPEIEGADVVYLCAGRTGGVGRMANDPLSFIYPNVRISMNVFEACSKAGVRRIVCNQSITGYPDSAEVMREDQYLEGEPHKSYFVPGNAGRFIYRLAQMFRELEVVFVRPSNVYGPRNNFDPKTSHVIEATVRKVAERQDPFVIWGNGLDTRDAIYIDDLVEAMIFGMDCPAGAYNIATGESMSVNEIVQVLCGYAGFHPTVQHDLTKPSAIPARRVDITKALSLGWKPKVSMYEGLGKTLQWYMNERS